MHFLKNISLDDLGFNDIEFSYVEVAKDLVAYRQDVLPNGKVATRVEIEIFKTDLMSEPHEKERYGFSGTVKPLIVRHSLQIYFFTELKEFHNLSYKGKKETIMLLNYLTSILGMNISKDVAALR